MDWINLIVLPAVKSIVLIVVLLTGFAYLTLFERKLVGRFSLRYGPNRAWKFGLGQPLADALKMIMKEEFIPGHVDKVVYMLGPVLALVPALAIFAVVPVAPDFNFFGLKVQMAVADVNVGLLYVLAIASVSTYGIVLGGWGSNNKYSLLGALRASSQMISYELPMGIMLIAILLMARSLSLVQILENQAHWPWYYWIWLWLIFPFFFVTSLAETNRSPFDLPETENELVAGFGTEYGGIKFALYYMGEYLHVLSASAILVTLFFGGWRGPFTAQVPFLGLVYFVIKVMAMIFLFIWVRASIPRIRYDQLLRFCWGFLFPLSLVYLALTAVGTILLPFGQ
ncbi:MAG TPA: NADH-quinone oxidoreductase subunit NuoH [Anaerolineae bacterium]